ncbi:hypothetical protein M409DRAFT_17324 [Zasmidium cellare ATCC 36951]|uniref:Rhodopsin domain-containing protein n=1 Tax=Zasmidium cellare ATCC 36951 TaxID=1080233 RepID=A0A6A6CYA9_ZASCE|nr:uncharacterized protein M409DRAFT_17324 [Zasmidium cellare ATCC 36951]KAF2172081.1 hypothetical protein M409DRAFT_17324 [Zasmidium cellare ATCC 36951]
MSLSSNHGFETTSDIDHRAWIWVASFLALIYSVLCLAARITSKWGLLWVDDGILVGAYVAAVVHWGLLYQSLVDGLAVSPVAITAGQLGHAARMYFGSRIPWFLAHCLSKMSILVFTRRIFVGDFYKENIFFGIAYAFTVIYGILAVLLSSAGCHPTQVLTANVNAVCNGNTGRWAALTAMDGFTELIVLAMPIWFISKNELKASKKRIVVFVYCFRLIVIAFTIATTSSYIHFLDHGRTNIDIAPVVAWQETLLAFSLISASFPCLRSFLWAFMSRGLMTMYGNTTLVSSSGHTGAGSHGASVQLRSLNKSQVSRNDSETGESRFRLRPDQVAYRCDVVGEPRKKGSGGLSGSSAGGSSSAAEGRGKRSDDSDRMIIHQETSYRVESIGNDV